MDIKAKFNLTVSSNNGITVEYLDPVTLTTVTSTVILSKIDIDTMLFDPYSPFASTTNLGAIIIKRHCDEVHFPWILPFCNIVNYNGSAIGSTTFATVQAAIVAARNATS
jgi:hypothetical protein